MTPATGASDPVAADIERLVALIAGIGPVVVAFSGGVDSSVVSALAVRAVGPQALAVTATSPALASGELEAARSVAEALGVCHETVRTGEIDREEYRRNDTSRCYYCKSELYDRLAAVARAYRSATVLSGANADDLGDWRPGLRAAAERGVRHPLVEAGIGKDRVRAIARRLGVPAAEKPASPCLASRIPYGTPVTRAALAQVDRAESRLKARGYRELRVRHFGDLGRVELSAAELGRVRDPAEREAVVSAVRAAGYGQVEIADEPLRSGSLNLLRLGPGLASP